MVPFMYPATSINTILSKHRHRRHIQVTWIESHSVQGGRFVRKNQYRKIHFRHRLKICLHRARLRPHLIVLYHIRLLVNENFRTALHHRTYQRNDHSSDCPEKVAKKRARYQKTQLLTKSTLIDRDVSVRIPSSLANYKHADSSNKIRESAFMWCMNYHMTISATAFFGVTSIPQE